MLRKPDLAKARDDLRLSMEGPQEGRRNLSQRLHLGFQTGWLSLLFQIRGPTSYPQMVLYVLYAYVLAFITKWAVAGALLAVLAPDRLLPSDAAVATIAEVLPALMVSVFVFLGSFFVVTQLATSIHSNRARAPHRLARVAPRHRARIELPSRNPVVATSLALGPV